MYHITLNLGGSSKCDESAGKSLYSSKTREARERKQQIESLSARWDPNEYINLNFGWKMWLMQNSLEIWYKPISKLVKVKQIELHLWIWCDV